MNTSIRTLCVCIGLFVCIGTCQHARADEDRARPSVLLVIADDFGWADIGANNPECFYDTPSIDAFARSGVNFWHGYAASPVCSPTRVSVMTGRSPVRTGGTEWFGGDRGGRYRTAKYRDYLPCEERTIAEWLRAEGYQTFFAGKWHLGHRPEHMPEQQGFDINIAGGSRGAPGKDGYFAPYQPFIGLDAPDGEHLPARLADETISFIRERDTSRPFLAVLSFYSVHTPLQGRADLVEKYERRHAELAYDEQERFGQEEQVWPKRKQPRRARLRQDHAVYAAMVEAMDEHLGRVLASLEEMGLEDNTLVILVSDNGGLSNAEGLPTANLPLRAGKGWLYEGGLRVPFVVRWPGVLPVGVASNTPVHTDDIVPTILDAVGIAPDTAAPLDGQSLRSALDGGLDGRTLKFHYPHYSNQGGFPGGVIREGRWKLIQRYEDGRTHLFDLRADPGERTDVAGANPARAEAMAAELATWLVNSGAHFLRPRKDGPQPWRPNGALADD